MSVATKSSKKENKSALIRDYVKAHRKARQGRNPQTGETIQIPAKTVVKFRLAKAFKDAVVPPKRK